MAKKPWLKATESKARQRILECLTRIGRPAMTGPLAVEIGSLWTLEETEQLLRTMVEEKVLACGVLHGKSESYWLANPDPDPV